MSGDYSVAACNCPRIRKHCPHCPEVIEAIGVYYYHIDHCHRQAINYGIALPVQNFVPPVAKSISRNASHQATS